VSFSTPDKHGLLGKPRSPRLDQFRREKGLTSMAWLEKKKLKDKQHVPHHLLLPKMIQAWGKHVTPTNLVTNVQGLLSRIQATLTDKSLSCLVKERRDKGHDALDHPLVMKEYTTRRGGPKRGVEEREIPLCMPFVKREIGKGASILKDGYLYILLDKGVLDKGVRKGVYEYAHRIVCFAYHGPPPSLHESYCLHRCFRKGRQTDSYDCLSPLHLEWGTPKENSKDRDRKKRRNPRNV
jgi:hypothetical protein